MELMVSYVILFRIPENGAFKNNKKVVIHSASLLRALQTFRKFGIFGVSYYTQFMKFFGLFLLPNL
jgi:hypothetical protein